MDIEIGEESGLGIFPGEAGRIGETREEKRKGGWVRMMGIVGMVDMLGIIGMGRMAG